jgi:hypothetical protein
MREFKDSLTGSKDEDHKHEELPPPSERTDTTP